MSRLCVVAVLVGGLMVTGCADPIVGASCRDGFREEAGRCVLVVGMDGGGDAGPADSGLVDGDIPDGAVVDGGRRDAGRTDAGVTGCDLGERRCGDMCVRPRTDPNHCGGCNIVCDAAEVCAGGVCLARCDPPLVMCAGLCRDVMASDPDHCGGCNIGCPTGLCVAGTCEEARAGHLVVVGHDYEMSRAGMRRIAGNSVFLASGVPVSVVVYEGDASAASISGVDRAVDQVAMATGRSWTRTVSSADELLLQLLNADALLIYPQRDATDASLAMLGGDLGRGLTTFLQRGGVVVIFDGPGANAGTWQLPVAAGIFDATGSVDVTSEMLDIVAPGDAVALGAPLSYRAEMSTVRFESMDEQVVVEHADGPVVVHRVFVP